MLVGLAGNADIFDGIFDDFLVRRFIVDQIGQVLMPSVLFVHIWRLEDVWALIGLLMRDPCRL